MGIEEQCRDAKLRIELRTLAKSIPTNKLEEAIEALKPLISQKSYEYQQKQNEVFRRELFGQVTCGVCGSTHHHRSPCSTCMYNCPG